MDRIAELHQKIRNRLSKTPKNCFQKKDEIIEKTNGKLMVTKG
jgi:hypothetical protein